ncbi:MAG TPA: hypothetical protein VF658_06700 [Pyrinomonadaceae bacterium]|jgi:hypothetical protein
MVIISCLVSGTALDLTRAKRAAFEPEVITSAAMLAPPLSPTTRPGYNFLARGVAEDRFFDANEALAQSEAMF